MILFGVPPLDNSSQLFWAFVVFAAVMVWVVHRVTDPRRNSPPRDPDPRDQRQHVGGQGSNIYDASTHTHTSNTINVGEVNVNSPRLPGSDE